MLNASATAELTSTTQHQTPTLWPNSSSIGGDVVNKGSHLIHLQDTDEVGGGVGGAGADGAAVTGAVPPVWTAHLLVVAACCCLLAVSFAAYHLKQMRVAAAKRHRLASRGRPKLRMMSSAVVASSSVALEDCCSSGGGGGSGGGTRLSADMGVPFGGSLGASSCGQDSGKRKGGFLMFDFRRQSGRGGQGGGGL